MGEPRRRPQVPLLTALGHPCRSGSDPVQCVVLGLPVAMANSSKACDVLYPEELTEFSLDQDQGVQSGARAAGFTHSPAPRPVLGTGGHGGQAGTHRMSHGHSGNHSAPVGWLSAPAPAAWGPWDPVVLGTDRVNGRTGGRGGLPGGGGGGVAWGACSQAPSPGGGGNFPSCESCFPAWGQGWVAAAASFLPHLAGAPGRGSSALAREPGGFGDRPGRCRLAAL